MTELVEITFGLADPTLEDDELLELTEKLLQELREIDAVEKADFTEDPNIDLNKKSIQTLLGSITTVVKLFNIQFVFAWFKERLQDKPIEIELEITKDGDKKIKIKTTSQNLPITKETVQDLLSNT